MECAQEKNKNTATALMSRAIGNTSAVNACTITGKRRAACLFLQ